jgi:chromosomal replication initiation ATPase DnaA
MFGVFLETSHMVVGGRKTMKALNKVKEVKKEGKRPIDEERKRETEGRKKRKKEKKRKEERICTATLRVQALPQARLCL